MEDVRGKPTDGPIAKYINRKISTRITRLIIRKNLPLTPNQVSLISFAIGLAGAILYLASAPIAAGVAVQASSIIDGVDGELARARGQTSRTGGFLDAILDRLVDISVITALTLYTYSLKPGLETLLVGMLALSGDIMVSYLHARGEASLGTHPARIGRVANFASRDVRLFIIFLGSLIGHYLVWLAAIAAISYAYIALKSLEVAGQRHVLQ